MWRNATAFVFAVLGGSALLAHPSPQFGPLRQFAGKIEGNWEYGAFRECGSPKKCSNAFKSCGYTVTGSARNERSRLLPQEARQNYWIEFFGRKRTASIEEMSDNLNPVLCVVEIQRIIVACESASPIYPDQEGKFPTCASSQTRRKRR